METLVLRRIQRHDINRKVSSNGYVHVLLNVLRFLLSCCENLFHVSVLRTTMSTVIKHFSEPVNPGNSVRYIVNHRKEERISMTFITPYNVN